MLEVRSCVYHSALVFFKPFEWGNGFKTFFFFLILLDECVWKYLDGTFYVTLHLWFKTKISQVGISNTGLDLKSPLYGSA